MLGTISPGAFSGPNTWYKKKIHSPMAARPKTRMGRAIAMLLGRWCRVLCNEKRSGVLRAICIFFDDAPLPFTLAGLGPSGSFRQRLAPHRQPLTKP
jgi:hypothetical protein